MANKPKADDGAAAAATAAAPRSPRRHDLDNLRTALTQLVIVHHTAIPYGGVGSWGFKSALFRDKPPSPFLLGLNAFNQSFFMGLFFWISGRVSAQSLAKIVSSSTTPQKSSSPNANGKKKQKTTRADFITSKILRLGLPAVVYTVAVDPLLRLAVLPRWDDVPAVRASLAHTFGTMRSVRGATWYAATLLAFDCVAAVAYPPLAAWAERWLDGDDGDGNERQAVPIEGSSSSSSSSSSGSDRSGRGNKGRHQRGRKATLHRAFRAVSRWGWLGVAACSYFVRLEYPVGRTIPLLSLQLAYAPQYVFAYAAGFASLFLDDEPRMVGLLDSATPPSLEPPGSSTSASGTGENATRNQQSDTQTSSTLDAAPPPSSSPPRPRKPIIKNSPTTTLLTTLSFSLLSMPIFMLPRYLDHHADWMKQTVAQFPGGGHSLPAALYAFWNELSFVLVGPALMAWFAWREEEKEKETQRKKKKKKEMGDETSKMTSATLEEKEKDKEKETPGIVTPRTAYAAFLAHTPVSLAVEMCVDWAVAAAMLSSGAMPGGGLGGRALLQNAPPPPWANAVWDALGPVAMTAFVGWMNVWASFYVGKKLLDWVPGMRRYV